MNPVLSEIYSTVLGGAPYVIAAYALIFAILMVYVIMTTLKLKNTEKKLDALEEHVEELLAAKKSRAGLVFCVCEIGAVGATDACRFFFLGGKGALGNGVPGVHSRRCSFALACSLFGLFPLGVQVSYNTPTQSNGPPCAARRFPR